MTTERKTVVVHRGSRDAYQAAGALAERGTLERLITDMYWQGDRQWGRALAQRFPALRARYAESVPSGLVDCCWLSGAVSFALDRLPGVPFHWKQRATRWADDTLGKRAGQLAGRTGAALLSYSYYASSAFAAAAPETPRILFQLHPHPVSVRKILQRERQDYPECAESLNKEWEIALPERDFGRLAGEALQAQHWIAASSFTRQTLIENGVNAERIHVVPYGVDSARFCPAPSVKPAGIHRPLRLLFVGTINQRKGIKYLLQALDLVRGLPLEMIVCGRPVDNLALFEKYRERVRLRLALSSSELLLEYQRADLFVFPSVAEGFGQVLLEAMACGLPVLTTTHTAAPDLIREGIDGFVVEPRRPDLLAQRIEWAEAHRQDLAEMGRQASLRAQHFTQTRFRQGIAGAIAQALSSSESTNAPAEREMAAYV